MSLAVGATVSPEYQITGTGGDGRPVTGLWAVPESDLPRHVKERFDCGWQELSVTLKGEEIAGIKGKGSERQWWAPGKGGK